MKTTTKRKSLILALVVLFVALAGLMLVNFNFKPVSAEGTFAMGRGASYFTSTDFEGVEGVEDPNGLQFTTTLSETKHNEFIANGATVRYFTLVAVNGTPVSELTVDKIDDETKAVQSFSWYPSEFINGTHVHNTNILNIPQIGWRDVISVRSYAIVTDANGVKGQPIYATGTDSIRSIEGVVNVDMYMDGDDIDGRYFVLGDGGQVVLTKDNIYLDAQDGGSFKLDGLDSKPEKATVYVAARRVFEATIAEDGTISLPGSYTETLVKDNSYLVTVLDGTNAYRGFLYTYDNVMEIASPLDFVAWYDLQNTNHYDDKGAPKFQVLAYLTNNIDMSGVTLAKWTAGTCASGVLDGQGYTISDLTIGGFSDSASTKNSLFEASYDMTYRNLAFKNLVGNNGYLFGCQSTKYYSVENCYIEYDPQDNGTFLGINHIVASGTFKNVVLVMPNTSTIFRPGFTPAVGSVKNFIAVTGDGTTALTLPAAYTNSYSVPEIWELFMLDDYTTLFEQFDTNYWTVDDNEGIFEWTGKASKEVAEEVSIDVLAEAAFNRADSKLVIDLTEAGTFSEANVKSVSIAGIDLPFTVADNKVSVGLTGLTTAGERTVKIVTDTKNVYAKALIYDYAIATSAEFHAYLKVIQGATVPVYGYLENNIVNEETTWAIDQQATKTYFDGKGCTIDGLITRNGVFGGLTGTVKNLALTNIKSPKVSAQGTFAWGGSAIIENVYVHANYALSGVKGTYASFNNGYNAGTHYRNLVFHIEVPEGVNGYTIRHTAQDWTIVGEFSNVYTFSNSAVGITPAELNEADGIVEVHNIKHYSDINVYRKDAQSIIDTLGDGWTLVDGLPVLESAAQYMGKKDLTHEVLCSTASMNGDVAEVLPGTHEIATTEVDANPTFALKEAVDGVSISGNVITIADSVAEDTEFIVVSTVKDYTYNETLSVEKTFRVTGAEKLVGTAQIVGRNRTTNNLTYNMSEYGTFTTDMISVATFNGVAIEGVTFENNKITVPFTVFTTTAEKTYDLVVVVKSATAAYEVTIPVTVYDFVIGNETEFNNWRNSAGTYTGNASELTATYAILDGNVKLENALAGFNRNAKRGMVGVLDGAGYTVSDINMSGGFLFSNIYGFTFKNLGLEIDSSASYFVAENLGKSSVTNKVTQYANHMDNCWVDYKGAANSFAHMGYLFGTVSNVVINYQTTTTVAFFRSNISGSTFTNVLGIAYNTKSSSAGSIFPSTPTGTNNAEFATVADATANLLGKEETRLFDTSVFATQEMQAYWTIDSTTGMPVWLNK